MKNGPAIVSTERYRKRLTEFLLDLLEKRQNVEKIKKLRLKIGLPVNGFEIDSGDEYRARSFKLFNNTNKNGEVTQTIKSILINEGLVSPKTRSRSFEYFPIFKFLATYIINGAKDMELLFQVSSVIFTINYTELATGTEGVRQIFEGRTVQFEHFPKGIELSKESAIELYPLALRFRPDTNKRDLIKFIETNYSQIIRYSKETMRLNDKDLTAFGGKRIKIKHRRELYTLIYANKEMKRSEIRALVEADERFSMLPLTDDYISIVVYLEKLRRT